MSDAADEQREVEPGWPLDRRLLAEATLYGVPYRAYLDMSPRERGAVKGRWANKLRAEARRRNVDPDEFLAMDEDGRDETRQKHPEHVPPRKAAAQERKAPARQSFEAVMQAHAPARQVADVLDEGLTDGDPDDDNDVPHSPMDEVPPTDSDPRMRERATLGEVKPVDNQDLVGWNQPRNLLDVYSRYTIGDGQHFIRVELIEPKVWQQIPCSGYIGDIREPMTEAQFHAWYGGRVYALTVYGPDPKGRRDPATGLPIIKAKTEPFRYTVPGRPPNLAVLPQIELSKQHGDPMNPFTVPGQGNMPATPADAQMHKSTLDFFQSMLARGDQEREQLRRTAQEGSGPSKDVLSLVSETSGKALDAAQKAAEQRESALREQIRESREDNRRLSDKLDKLLEEKNQGRPNPVQDAVALMQVSNPGKSSEEEVKRQREAHAEEMSRIREGHREAMVALKDRQDDELKRLRERLDDVEKQGRARLDEAERRWRDREKELKDQNEQTRREERDVAERRVAETVARFDDRIKDMREQHNRELRMQSEQHTTRVDTTKGTWEMQLANAKERLARAEQELEEARAEAERSKDPVQVIEKVTAQAEALGFSKKDEGANQSAGERFMGTVGMGLSKALETMNEWLPKAMDARRGGPQQLQPGVGAPRALPGPQGQQRPQQQQMRPAQSRRAVAWATQTSSGVPVAPPPPQGATFPQQPMAPIQASPPQPAPMPQSMPEPESGPQPVAEVAPPPAPMPQPPQNGQGLALHRLFPEEVAAAFRQEVERAINVGLPADAFAERFTKQFPEPSLMLVSGYTPENLMEYVRAMPNSADSPILRRDGRTWIARLWERIRLEHQPPQPVAQA
jgi:hypothetical protein